MQIVSRGQELLFAQALGDGKGDELPIESKQAVKMLAVCSPLGIQNARGFYLYCSEFLFPHISHRSPQHLPLNKHYLDTQLNATNNRSTLTNTQQLECR